MDKTNTSKKKRKLDAIIELVNNSEISSIKQTITQILNTISDPNSSAKDLGNAIEVDPPLSAKILKLANSAFYGFLRRISDIQEAIVCIGFDAVRDLALSQKVCELFAKTDVIDGYSRISLWKHSIASAICGRLIYKSVFIEGGEHIYAAGLLHDLGIIVIDQFMQFDFINILRKINIDKSNLVNVEDSVLGYNHMDIGGAISENWNFPDELTAAIGNHHTPDRVEERFSKIVSTIFISEYITQIKNIGYDESPYKNKILFNKCLRKLKLKEKLLDSMMEEVKEEIIKMEKAGWF
jgi:HD-like signal output (HDOD) protein